MKSLSIEAIKAAEQDRTSFSSISTSDCSNYTILKMRAAILVLLIFSVVMLAGAYTPRPWQRPRPHTGSFPTFPGHGPFNPRPRWPDAYGRGRRSAAYVDDLAYVNAEDTPQGGQVLNFEPDPRLAFE